jgi:uncharacterized repeat protein (TIGR04138 family)
MNFRDELAGIIATDPRYTIEAYVFVLEALDAARHQKLKARGQERGQSEDGDPKRTSRQASPRSSKTRDPGHVTGQELCGAAQKLALRQFGLLAATVLNGWGIYSTSDMGEIVYNLIAAGDLEKTERDLRSDFDDVFDFDQVLRPPAPPTAGGGS